MTAVMSVVMSAVMSALMTIAVMARHPADTLRRATGRSFLPAARLPARLPQPRPATVPVPPPILSPPAPLSRGMLADWRRPSGLLWLALLTALLVALPIAAVGSFVLAEIGRAHV